MIRMPKPLLDEIHTHSRSAYPNECCGLIVGTLRDHKVVHAVRRCNNLNTERSRDRYTMDPRDMLRVQREFEDSPWDIVGIYHSHPDHPSRPSQFDTDRAWPDYSYMIVSVHGGTVASTESWQLDDGERRFHGESLIIEGEPGIEP